MQNDEVVIQGYLGITSERKKSRLPARLDVLQSATGLFLGLFMIAHMFFVSSILLGESVMYKVAKFFEGSVIFSEPQPFVVSIVAVVVIVAFVAHAFLALRKFPINFRQFSIFKAHKMVMKHGDTSYWGIQACTGFALFFLASVHLFIMFSQPDTIGPQASAYRFVHQHFWILYIVLLFAVELHMSIGMYRLCVKWGWFENLGLESLRKIKMAMSAFFIILGLLTFGAYVKIGLSQNVDSSSSIQQFKALDSQLYGN